MCCVCSYRYGQIGGSWLYPMKDEKTGDDLVSIGFIVDLDYADATVRYGLCELIGEGGERFFTGTGTGVGRHHRHP